MRPFRGRSGAREVSRGLPREPTRLYARADAVSAPAVKPVRQSLAQLPNRVSKEEK